MIMAWSLYVQYSTLALCSTVQYITATIDET